MADAVALGATVLWTCRFESCPRHRSLGGVARGAGTFSEDRISARDPVQGAGRELLVSRSRDERGVGLICVQTDEADEDRYDCELRL